MVRTLFRQSLGTAIACGLGAIPFIWKKTFPKKWLGYANALAGGMMIAASFDLIYQGIGYAGGGYTSAKAVIWGIIIGLVFIMFTSALAEKYEHLSNARAASKKKKSRVHAIILIIVMTMHSGAEGIAMGVSRGAASSLGILVTIVIALQNIPEGLAISLKLVPNGTPRWKAALRSIATSLPQPLLAVPAYLFVSHFRPIVPGGLGFAAGCMIWMCFADMFNESYEGTDPKIVGVIVSLSVVFLLWLQMIIS